MIKLTEIITHLRANLPSWSIEGAVDLVVAEDESQLKLPAMYVGLSQTIYTTLSKSTFLQTYLQNFFIITCTPAPKDHDRTGKYGQDYVPTLAGYLFRLLVNNKDFDPDSHVIMMVKDSPLKLDKARYYHKFEFVVEGAINQDDVTPLELDYFDTLFAEYVPPTFTEDTPTIESFVTSLYFTAP